jgi:hypothetical protein
MQVRRAAGMAAFVHAVEGEICAQFISMWQTRAMFRTLRCSTLAVLACIGLVLAPAAIAQTDGPAAGETIVLVRHGEKPLLGLGQLTCKGLNRALALPNLLVGRFGKPAAIYAPKPSELEHDNHAGAPPSPLYAYVRPLVTIEPTAIQLGLPVEVQLERENLKGLERAVTAPRFAHSVVYIAWEHGLAEDFAKQMLSSYGEDPSAVPNWPDSDYETMYVFRIAPKKPGQTHGTLTFTVEKEGLGPSLSDTCPDNQRR